MTEWAVIAVSFHLASRLAYVIGVGIALTLQERHQRLTRMYGPDGGFRRFRRIAATLMIVDCATFILMCLVTRHSLPPLVPEQAALGGMLIVVGASMKLWAALSLGFAACYWHNFFVPCPPIASDPPGPYRFLKNPMYTVGYLYTYGLALVFGSLPGLLFAAFDQAAILIFYHGVEKPHFEQLSSAEYDGAVAGD